ncbi:hypothetical protein VMCG_10001 [Cytospora schulzeri]|uniref:Uncharacterized protein n=1 Tax=Cytospora schulzeri TaxID=448051 RepID=A0A423VI23_9PEZI|nr:hypothetical protein VMCG_10001 [Valsa malicola]
MSALRNSSSTTSTKKEARDPFYLEKDLQRAQAATSAHNRAQASPSTQPTGVGQHNRPRSFIEDDPKKWPQNTRKVIRDGVPMLEDKTTGKVLKIVVPKSKIQKTSASLKNLYPSQLFKGKGKDRY